MAPVPSDGEIAAEVPDTNMPDEGSVEEVARKVVAEFTGTMLLVATIIGSGIMGDLLSVDDGVALLGNTLATWGILFVLITTFGPVSGAHFNPVVSTCFFLKRDNANVSSPIRLLLYFVAQFAGGITGALVAHGMFSGDAFGGDSRDAANFDGKDRNSGGELFAEFVATVGLLITIFGGIAAAKGEKNDVPMAVGLYITAGYWYTSSTSFANPAVTVARSFTNSFAGISVASFPHYFAGQALGLLVGLPFCEWMFTRKTVPNAFATLLRVEGKSSA
jgi:glycerol uptake facilitator-like aquaporin